MRIAEETRESGWQGTVVVVPMGLGFGDCVALLLSAVLLAVSILGPRRVRAAR